MHDMNTPPPDSPPAMPVQTPFRVSPHPWKALSTDGTAGAELGVVRDYGSVTPRAARKHRGGRRGSRRGGGINAVGQAVVFAVACVVPGDRGDGCGGRPLLRLLCQEEEVRAVTSPAG